MELPDVGAHCAIKTCNALDFLPVKCPLCEQPFCGDHRLPMDHRCTEWARVDRRLSQCSSCQELINANNLAPEEALRQHLDSGCKLFLYKKPLDIERKPCTIPGCKDLDPRVGPVRCNGCNGDFCLGHRHPSSHACSGPVNIEKEKEQRKSAIQEKLAAIRKTAPTAAKTQNSQKSTKPMSANLKLMLMKKKAKPIAAVHAESRIYLFVEFPRHVNRAPEPMYFDKSSSIGKTLDMLATYCKVRNDNHRLAHDDGKRLALHNAKTLVPLDNGLTLSSALTDLDTIILEQSERMTRAEES